MKIVENKGTYQMVIEYDYTPTIQELLYYYSGTHSGINPNNPYGRNYGKSAKKIRYIKATPNRKDKVEGATQMQR